MKNTIKKTELALFAFYSFSLQFANITQLANTSSLLSLLHAKGSTLASLWLVAPVTGLCSAIIFGQLSDMTHSRYGKRKPYIFICGILLAVALFFLPLSQNLIIATLFLLLFYTSTNGCTWPLQAWIGDNIKHSNLPVAYAIQAVGTGIGGLAAGILISAGNNYPTIHFSSTIHFSFITFSFLLSMLVIMAGTLLICLSVKDKLSASKKNHLFDLTTFYLHLRTFIKDIYFNIIHPSPFLKKIWVSQLFLWYAIYSFWVYLPLAISEHFYGLSDPLNSQQANLLAKGTALTGTYYGISEFSATLFTICLPLFLKKKNEGQLFAIFLFIGGSSLILSMSTHNFFILYLAMIGTGALIGTFLSLPLIALIKQLSENSRGVSLGVFNLTVTIPQILSGLTVGHLHTYVFNGHADVTMIFNGILILLAALWASYQFFIIR